MGCGSSSSSKTKDEAKKKQEDNNANIKSKEKETLTINKPDRPLQTQTQKEEDFPQHRNPDSDGEFGYEDEVYDENNYGRPIRIGNQTWLTFDFPVVPDTLSPKVTLPRGWRIPTVLDYLVLFNNVGELQDKQKAFEFLTGDKFKMNKESLYVTCSKKFKDKLQGHLKESWVFKCVGFEDFAKIDETRALDKRDEEIEHKMYATNPTVDNLIENIKAQNEGSEMQHVVSDLILQMEKELEANKVISTVNKIDEEEENEDISNNEDNEEDKEKLIDEYLLDVQEEGVNQKALEQIYHYIPHYNKTNPEEDLEEHDLLHQEDPQIQDSHINIKEPYTELYNIFDINTFHYKSILSCKLIANEVLGVDYISDIVGQCGSKMFFTIPKLFNITTFLWDFDDQTETSNKKTVSHVFNRPGEYEVKLHLTLFSNRQFTLEKEIWIVEQFEYGEDEIVNEINYGKPIRIGSQIWMPEDLDYYIDYKMDEVCLLRGKGAGMHGENSYIDSVAACPRGWRLPLKEDIQELLNHAGRTQEQKICFLLMKEGFNAKVNQNGIYDAVCVDFVNSTKSGSRKSLSNSAYNTSYIKSKTDSLDDSEVTDILDTNFLQNLRNYDHLIINSLNFKDIFQKEVYCLRIDNDKTFVFTRSTSMSLVSSFFSTRCLAAENFDLDIGLSDDYYPVNEQIQFNITQRNVISFEWDFGDYNSINAATSNIRSPVYTYTKSGEYEITVKLVLFGDRLNTVKKKVFIQEKENLDTENNTNASKFKDFSQISILQLGDKYKVKRNDMIHFAYQSAPIARIPNSGGNFFLAFNDMNDLTMKVLKIKADEILSKDDSSINKAIYKLEYALPLDIVVTSKGVAFLLKDLRDDDSLFIQSINFKGEILFTNSIMQNGTLPIAAEKNQLTFIEPETEKPVFGMNAMHKPYSGRLSYGNGKILVIFSYNNYFGSSKGEREDHSGDTVISYSDDGSEVHLAANWSTSHSLTQRAVFDGKHFYTASLGDALPHNVKVLRIDPAIRFNVKVNGNLTQTSSKSVLVNVNESDVKFDRYFPLNEDRLNESSPNKGFKNITKDSAQKTKMNLRHDFIFAQMIQGSIPGDMRGKSSGRLSDITPLGNNLISLAFSRIPCMDSGETNTKNEFALILFDSHLKAKRQIAFSNADLINCIKQAKFGNNLFIMYSKSKKKFNNKYIVDYSQAEEESIDVNNPQCNAFLLSKQGKIISKVCGFPLCIFSPADDFETLDDGSVVWAYIDNENNLNLCFLFNKKVATCDSFKSVDKYAVEVIEKRKEEKKRIEEENKERMEEWEINEVNNKEKDRAKFDDEEEKKLKILNDHLVTNNNNDNNNNDDNFEYGNNNDNNGNNNSRIQNTNLPRAKKKIEMPYYM